MNKKKKFSVVDHYFFNKKNNGNPIKKDEKREMTNLNMIFR